MPFNPPQKVTLMNGGLAAKRLYAQIEALFG